MAFVAAGAVGNDSLGSGNPLVVAIPSHSNGDLLVAWGAKTVSGESPGGSFSNAVTSGLTWVEQVTGEAGDSSAVRLSIWTAVGNGTATTVDIEAVISGVNGYIGQCLAFSGRDGTVETVAATVQDSGVDIDSPSITPSVSGADIVRCFVFDDAQSTDADHDSDGNFKGTSTGYDERTDPGNGLAAAGSYQAGVAGGATGTSTWSTNGDTDAGVAITIALLASGGGETLATYGWRLRADDGVEASGGAAFLAVEDTAIEISATGDVDVDENFRIRIGLDETNTGDPATGVIQLRAKINNGTAFDVDAASTGIRMSASSHFADGAATTDHGLAAPAGAFLAGEILETDGSTTSLDLAQNEYTIVEACVQARSADLSDSDSIEFGLLLGGVDYFPGATMATVGAVAAPANVAVGTATRTTIDISWTDPNTPDVPIRAYWKLSTDSIWMLDATLSAGTLSHTFGTATPLAEGTSHDIGVSAWNDPSESVIEFVTSSTTSIGGTTFRFSTTELNFRPGNIQIQRLYDELRERNLVSTNGTVRSIEMSATNDRFIEVDVVSMPRDDDGPWSGYDSMRTFLTTTVNWSEQQWSLVDNDGDFHTVRVWPRTFDFSEAKKDEFSGSILLRIEV